MLAQVSNLQAGEMYHVIADAHIYDRHVPLVKELLQRTQYPAPKLIINPIIKDFYEFKVDEKRMKAIVSVDQHWGIGYKGCLLAKIPEDMRFFKQTTIGQVVIMGRGTFESLPGQKPLPERINLVLSTKDLKHHSGILVCHSLRELAETLKKYPHEEVFVIGGEKVFPAATPLLHRGLRY